MNPPGTVRPGAVFLLCPWGFRHKPGCGGQQDSPDAPRLVGFSGGPCFIRLALESTRERGQ